MYVYTTGQWVLLFFFYCLCGWIWESCYVSLRQGHWVDRGFLHGPVLPIYGSGAIIILLATIPVAEDLRLVWLFGMAAATALEYVTGAVMERIFKVRYWDYSSQRFNLNGHICLSSSIAWGFFSILMVRFLHPPVARLLARIPALCVDPLAHVLTAAFTVDAVRSVQAALDLRDMLARLAEENEDLRRLAKRAEVYAAFAKDDLRRFRERTELERLELQERLEEGLAERRQARAERVEASLRRRLDAKLEILSAISGALETCRDHLDDLPELTGEELEARRAELEELVRRVREREAAIRSRPAAPYHRALRILRAHPSATAARSGEVLEALKKLGKS
ncbi:putative ABC transporter permease [uncultured Oscillibacter sp.]|uniref:putative ABC transporter permease n=1 Tax=uncultured Oscillibacter sp. TaxID=876091 RepID=UPI0025E1DA97|nr:hypothetical protein [uncultured Oscillibacter sp.]